MPVAKPLIAEIWINSPAAHRERRLRSVRSGYQDSLTMDARLLLVTAPILLAVAWAVFNIGRAAVGQLQLMLKRSRA